MDTDAGTFDRPPQAEAGAESNIGGIPTWRVLLAGALLLGAGALWFGVARQESRFAHVAVGPDADLLSPNELEDQLHM
ncbi:MAG: hypothetical protein QHJ73_03615 [Armatimonadota bacterium]|jgi:soluble lytic murein transglycosylase-like protein|nr:hypothetical protein [Armatimonadota bacterium]